MTKIVCWNINRSPDAYPALQTMGADVALLQEVGQGAAAQMTGALGGSDRHWDWAECDRWPAVANLRPDRVKVEWFDPVHLPVLSVEENEIAVSDPATLAAARVTPLKEGDPFIVVSMYGRWQSPHPHADNETIYSDASVHRIISDLSGFIGGWPKAPRIIAAGDLNTIYGAREESTLETPARAQTIFDRMTAIGMEFVGPRAGDGGRKADPPSPDVPLSTCNVPTFHTNRQTPETAQNQLDYVFTSRGFDESVRVHAMNDPKVWGPSDHCRIVIEVG